MRTLVIGNKTYSSWSLRPWLFMRHFDVEFDEIVLPLDTPEYFRRIPDYSPTGRVPVLLVDGDRVWDSLAICETVNERWLGGRGWPADPRARAAARSAACEMHSGFAALRAQMPMNCKREPRAPHWDEAASRDIARVEAIWRELRGRFGGDAGFLCGDFGIVDAMFAPVCIRLRGYGPPIAEDSRDYLARVLDLPAMREWQAAAEAEPARVEADEA